MPAPSSASRRETISVERVVPGDRVVATVAAIAGALERLCDPIRVVRHLDGRLAARTEPALVDRVRRAAFELLGREDPDDAGLSVPHDIRVGVHHADGQAASSRAQRADARLPHRDARHDVLVGHEPDELVLAGLPQLASAALVPETAVSLMNERRSIS